MVLGHWLPYICFVKSIQLNTLLELGTNKSSSEAYITISQQDFIDLAQ